MVNYPRILFPVDLSEQSRVVAEHVATMVDKFQSELHMVHVIARYGGPTLASVTEVMDQIKENARKEVDDFAADLFSPCKTSGKTCVGGTQRSTDPRLHGQT